MITLVTMGQGNPIALKRTLDSFKGHVSEVIFGDLCIFQNDRDLIHSYRKEYNMKCVLLDFNFVFKNGFSAVLNNLAQHATNNLCLYMNVSEVIDPNTEQKINITEGLLAGANSFFFTHATETHQWYRLWDKTLLQWNGLIHEEVHPKLNMSAMYWLPTPAFQMADTEKDMQDPFKAKVYNDIKELCYFNQYLRLVDEPEMIGNTNEGWVNYAKDSYASLKERMEKKGKRLEAFRTGNLQMYLDDIASNVEFAEERQESSTLVNLQGIRKDVL